MPVDKTPNPPDIAAALRSVRWPLAAIIGLIFALTRLGETTLVGLRPTTPLINALDPLFWGVLAALAVWGVLSWAAAQEQRYRTAERHMLDELQLAHQRLQLLYELNQRIASSATLDEVLDYAVTLPGELVGARAAAVTLYDEQGSAFIARCVGLTEEQLAVARSAVGLRLDQPPPAKPEALTPRGPMPADLRRCLVMPLVEGDNAPVGWIECYLNDSGDQASDALNALTSEFTSLLITIGGEIAEAVQGSRRRAREIASLVALEQAITAERTRIARDLHDGVAQSLAFLRMRVALWEDWLEQEPERLREEFDALKTNLRRQIEELRRAIFALRPIELSQLGFAGALRRFVSEFADQQDWDLELELSDLPPDLPYALELAAFRFVQEALNNAAKHANARHVVVALRVVDGGLQIIVRDDGAGFDPGAQGELPGARLGLRQMRERAAALDGRLTILSRPGQGAEVRVWLPLCYAREAVATSRRA
ncbi:MAG: sensor histidine kinase [Chloroflexaceae bacterium]|nr:sensor histidine kinase [Chloroflexaceae bacterium]